MTDPTLQPEETGALQFKPLPGGTYTVEKPGIHHLGCTPGAGMHHEDDCPRGLRTEIGAALEDGPVPIEFISGREAGAVVYGGGIKAIDGDPPMQIATVFWTEGL
jgi:hypothetical protein